jgi:hypothetical protein
MACDSFLMSTAGEMAAALSAGEEVGEELRARFLPFFGRTRSDMRGYMVPLSSGTHMIRSFGETSSSHPSRSPSSSQWPCFATGVLSRGWCFLKLEASVLLPGCGPFGSASLLFVGDLDSAFTVSLSLGRKRSRSSFFFVAVEIEGFPRDSNLPPTGVLWDRCHESLCCRKWLALRVSTSLDPTRGDINHGV